LINMKKIKQLLTRYKSQYAAGKANKVTATQLDRLTLVGALVDDDGQVWIKSKTILIDLKESSNANNEEND